jgi:simple sugar transport system ATP-binding protein
VTGVPHIAMERIAKRFGATVANADVSFELRPGEVHALLGENGAGKSTLMSILYGLIAPDEGRIALDGRAVRFASPADALRAGIGMVHQHFMLVPSMTVAENVVIGSRSSTGLSLRPRRIEVAVAEVATRYGLDVDPGARVADLPVEDRQRVELVRLLYRGASTLILDEPTAALGSTHVQALLETIRSLRAAGRSIVMVTHKLDEVMAVADRATVLRGGRSVTTFSRVDLDRGGLTRAMFGALPAPEPPPLRAVAPGPSRLEISGLVVRGGDGRELLRGLDLSVRPGEIVGVAGVAGNGQSELVEAVAGVLAVDAGTIRIGEADITRLSPRDRHRAGLSVIPEDRHHAGLVLDMTAAENLALALVPAGAVSRRGLLRRDEIDRRARELIAAFDVRPADPHRPVAQLSGGNQQKLVVARELARRPRVLVAASPTRGLDLEAAASIHRSIADAAREGCAVVVTSPDLDELLALADRIVVVFEGRVAHDVTRADATVQALGTAMVGPSDPRVLELAR